jgi:ABC-type polysaccharide/polyol phosphate export permease
MLAYLRSIWACRYFWLSLVRLDLRSRYRGSVLGMGWSLLNPLAMTVILCVVFSTLFNQPIRTFGPQVLVGLTFWSFVVNCTAGGCLVYFTAEPYIRQHPAPMAIYPLRTMLGSSFHFVLALALAFVLSVVLQNSLPEAGPTTGTFVYRSFFPSWQALLSLVPTLLLLAVLGWSMATLLALCTVMFRDTKHITEIALQALFYLTPIMYTEQVLHDHNRGRLAILVGCNPLTWLLQLLREPIVGGVPPSPQLYLAAGVVTLVAFVTAAAALRAEERKVIFHL